MKERIFIIEDEKELADLLENIFSKENFKVQKFYSGLSALKEIKTNKPDVILMSLILPDLSGLQLCKEIKEFKETADIPIIVLTNRNDEYDILNAFNFGCADYIIKPFNEKILVARVKACLKFKSNRVSANNNENILKYGGLEINPDAYEAYLDKKLIDLTPLEFKLLYFLAKKHGKVFSRGQILEEIYENYYERGDRSIDILVNRLRKKLRKYAGLIETIYGVGYSFKFEEEGF